MKPTPHEDINDILQLLTNGLSSILGNNLVCLYLTGSLTYGDFVRGSSDIDFLAIIDRDLNADELAKLRKLHEKLGKKYPEWATRTEGSYTPKKWFESIRKPTGKRWYYNGGKFTLGRYGNEWALNLSVLRERGITLYGPSSGEYIPYVNPKIVRSSSRRALLNEWQSRLRKNKPFEEKGYDPNHIKAYTILTMCRVLHRMNSDNIASKRIASSWVKKKYPQWKALIKKAEDWAHGQKIREEKEIVEFMKFTIQISK